MSAQDAQPPPVMWWSPSDPDRLSTYDDIEVMFLDLNGALPKNAVRLVPETPALDTMTDDQALTRAAEILAATTDPMDSEYQGDGGLLWQSWAVPSGLCYDEMSDYAEGVQTDPGKRAQMVIAARAMIAAALAGTTTPTDEPAGVRLSRYSIATHLAKRIDDVAAGSVTRGWAHDELRRIAADVRSLLASTPTTDAQEG